MKYVCSLCGTMLRVDKDLDDDRAVEAGIAHHRAHSCPGQFDEAVETPWKFSYQQGRFLSEPSQ